MATKLTTEKIADLLEEFSRHPEYTRWVLVDSSVTPPDAPGDTAPETFMLNRDAALKMGAASIRHLNYVNGQLREMARTLVAFAVDLLPAGDSRIADLDEIERGIMEMKA